MGIEAKHSYRFQFLKSEEWLNIRAAVLAREKGMCFICDVEDVSNDVHHMYYRKQWKDTNPKDCHVLCRRCHESVHEHMNADELKDMSAQDLAKAFIVLCGVIRRQLIASKEISGTPPEQPKTKKPSDYLREELARVKAECKYLKEELNKFKEYLPVDWSDWVI